MKMTLYRTQKREQINRTLTSVTLPSPLGFCQVGRFVFRGLWSDEDQAAGVDFERGQNACANFAPDRSRTAFEQARGVFGSHKAWVGGCRHDTISGGSLRISIM